MGTEPWQFRFIDGWSAVRPSGGALTLRSRKARALLTMLVLNRAPMTKSELVSQLWPGAPTTKQKQSLRRAIADIRAASEPDTIIESRQTTVTLATKEVRCDVLEAIDRAEPTDGEILPDLPELFFEPFRMELESIVAIGQSHSAMRGLVELLDWLHTIDPGRIIDVLFASRELLAYLPMPTLERALNRGLAAAPDHPKTSWAHVQLAIAKMWQGATSEGLEHARAVLANVRPDENLAEWTQAISAAATVLVFRGSFRRAEALLDMALDTAEQFRAVLAVQTLNHTLAHCLGYSGRLQECRNLLEGLDDDVVSNPMLVLRHAHRAIYALLDRDMSASEAHLARALAGLPGDADFRLASQVHMAEAYVLLAKGDNPKSLRILGDLVRGTADFHLPLVEVHSREGLAFALKGSPESERYAESAVALRMEHGLPILPLDLIRFEIFS